MGGRIAPVLKKLYHKNYITQVIGVLFTVWVSSSLPARSLFSPAFLSALLPLATQALRIGQIFANRGAHKPQPFTFILVIFAQFCLYCLRTHRGAPTPEAESHVASCGHYNSTPCSRFRNHLHKIIGGIKPGHAKQYIGSLVMRRFRYSQDPLFKHFPCNQ